MAQLVVLRTAGLGAELLAEVRAVVVAAFDGDFQETDWVNALGGHHAVVTSGGAVVAHAAVVPRTLEVGGRPVRTGYLEAVATAPEQRGRGHGTAAARAATDLVRRRDPLGALSTGLPAFYARLGWLPGEGPTAVGRGAAVERTPDDDGGVLVLPLAEPDLDRSGLLVCDDRPGDVW